MAQVGSFVPADFCRIGAVDKLFSRVGASDDLYHGRSTFIIEMSETAAIVNQATPRSLVVLDEVGRGTSTYDGLSIAQACMEHMNEVVGCKTLFAIHYHELADAAESMPGAACMCMEVDLEQRDGSGFSYKVAPGKAGKSYGITVARIAGMPSSIIARAEALLAEHTGTESTVGSPQTPGARSAAVPDHGSRLGSSVSNFDGTGCR